MKRYQCASRLPSALGSRGNARQFSCLAHSTQSTRGSHWCPVRIPKQSPNLRAAEGILGTMDSSKRSEVKPAFCPVNGSGASLYILPFPRPRLPQHITHSTATLSASPHGKGWILGRTRETERGLVQQLVCAINLPGDSCSWIPYGPAFQGPCPV